MNSSSILIAADVINDQTIGGYTTLGNTVNNHIITLNNGSAVATLIFKEHFVFQNSFVDVLTLKLEGVGDIRFDKYLSTNGKCRCFIANNSSGTITMGGNFSVNYLTNRNGLDTGNTHLVLKPAMELFLDRSDENYSIWHEGSGLIEGGGVLRLGVNPTNGAPARVYVKTGSTLTIRTPITSSGGVNLMSTVSGGGKLIFDGINTLDGNLVNTSIGTFSVAKMGNQGSSDSNVGKGSAIQFRGAGAGFEYTGTGESSDRIFDLTHSGRVIQNGSGDLILTSDFMIGGNGLTLTLLGDGSGAGVIAGVLGDGPAGVFNVAKSSSGEWRLSNTNQYSGTTTIGSGLLTLCGSGTINKSSSINILGGTLCISNSAVANMGDRIKDTSAVVMQGGGKLYLAHDSSEANFSETLGALSVGDGKVSVEVDAAAEGYAAALNFASITRSGSGSINFVGVGLGAEASERCRVLFATPPPISGGYVESWVTVNGVPALYDGTRGLYAADDENMLSIAARGPDSEIPDNSLAIVAIDSAGTSGPITLAGASDTEIYMLTQAVDTEAVVAMEGKTFTSQAIVVQEAASGLTIGESVGSGTLRVSSGKELTLRNDAEQPLTINANVGESSALAGLKVNGSGAVVLNGRLNVSGTNWVEGGSFTLGERQGEAHRLGREFNMVGGVTKPVEMTIKSAAEVVDYGNFYVGRRSGDRCVLTIEGDLKIQASTDSAGGILYVGVNAKRTGTVIQRSGEVVVSTGLRGSVFTMIGNTGGGGYYRMEGGTLTTGEIAVGGSGSDANNHSSGVFEMYGGELTLSGWCLLLSWGKAVSAVNIFEGSLGGSGGGGEILFNYGANVASTAQLNLLGPQARLFDRGTAANKKINLARGASNVLAALNLNDGEMTLYKVDTRDSNNAPVTTMPSHFNFNGGLLKAADSVVMMENIMAANVFSGNARIDSNGFTPTINQALLAPVGFGVKSIALVSGGAGYIGAPAVAITGGAGTGATAIAQVDLNKSSLSYGQITNILVTGAGIGYKANDTLTATLYGGGYSTVAEVGGVSLAENVSGGLIKLGSGTLTLSAACTYTGGTIVSNGTLRLTMPDALPRSGVVQLEPYTTLDLNGLVVTNEVDGLGTVVNGTLVNAISPGGEDTIGTQTITLGIGADLAGTYSLDVTQAGECDWVLLAGNVDLTEVELRVNDISKLNRRKRYAIGAVSGLVGGLFGAHNLPDERWQIKADSSGALWLFYSDGMVLMLR